MMDNIPTPPPLPVEETLIRTLSLRIGSNEIAYTVARSTSAETKIVDSGSFSFNKVATDYCKRLEDTLFDHPMLLEEYDRTNILIDTNTFLLVPKECCDGESPEKILKYVYTDFHGATRAVDISGTEATTVFGVDNDVATYLQRTFGVIDLNIPINVILRYYAKRTKQSSSSRMYVVLVDNVAYVSVFNSGNLMAANRFEDSNVDNMVYLIMNLWQTMNLDQMNSELHVIGNSSLRSDLIQGLRNFVAYVMPGVYPSPMHKLSSKTSSIPFDLMLLNDNNSKICE